MRCQVVLLALAVVSCSPSDSADVVSTPSTTVAPTTSPPTTPPPTTGPPTTTTAPETQGPSSEASECPDDIRAAATVTANGQHLALIDGDFERALTFSSSAFRAGVTPDQFAMIIRSGYPFLLEPNSSESLDCLLASDVVALTVRFRLDSGSEVDLAYRMVEENGRFAIEAAGVLPPPEVDV